MSKQNKKTIKKLLLKRDAASIDDICDQYKLITKTVCREWGCYHSSSKQIYSRPIYHAALIHYEYKVNGRSVDWICDNLDTNRNGNAQIKHMCGDNDCFNPAHLVVGTQMENEIEKHYHFFIRHTSEDMQDVILGNPVAMDAYLAMGGVISRSQGERLDKLWLNSDPFFDIED